MSDSKTSEVNMEANTAPRSASVLREQLQFCIEAYLQTRPGSRAAAETIRDRQILRDELAAALRIERRASRDKTAKG